MKRLALIAGVVTFGLSSVVTAENYYLPAYVEMELISICKSAAKDKLLKMTKSIKGIRLNEKTVALNVVCNGQDIISFAESYGAKKTTARLNSRIGTVKVTDIAAMREYKYDVTFDFH